MLSTLSTTLHSTAPEIRAPGIVVDEDSGTAEVCVEIGNEIENTFTVEYSTRVIADGATGMLVTVDRV